MFWPDWIFDRDNFWYTVACIVGGLYGLYRLTAGAEPPKKGDNDENATAE